MQHGNESRKLLGTSIFLGFAKEKPSHGLYKQKVINCVDN